MIIGVRYDDFIYFCRSASKKSSLAIGIDVNVIPLYFNEITNELSQKISMCLNVQPPIKYSSTSHPRTNPANSKLFIVTLTFGF